MTTSRRTFTALIAATSLLLGPVTVPAEAQANPISRVILGAGSDETQHTVSWRTTFTGAESLQFHAAASPDKVTTVPGAEQDNGALMYRSMEATITGLKPNTDYVYRVGSDNGGWSAPFTFRTQDFDSTWNFITVADAQIGVDLKNAEQGAAWRRALDKATTDFPNTEMIVSLGDQVDGWGAIVPQYDEYFSPDQLRHIPVAAIAGNHETYLGGIKHFEEHFSLPNEVGSTGDYYYERNNALFIGLNSNRATPAEIAEHISFLRETVAKRGAHNDWIVVTYHHGPFSQGSHVSDADVVALREALTPVLSELDVDLVLSGHDHIYTRSHLMNGTSPVVPDKRAERGDRLTPKDGEVLYVTTTTAGGGKYYDFTDVNGAKHPGARRELIDPNLEQPWTAYWRQDYTPDYMNVQVSPTELTLTTYNVDTPYVVDKVTLVNPKPPVSPTPRTSTPTVKPTPTSAPSSAVVSTSKRTTEPGSTRPTTSSASPSASPAPTPSPQPETSGSSAGSSIRPWWRVMLAVLGIGGILGGLAWYAQQAGWKLPELKLPKFF